MKRNAPACGGATPSLAIAGVRGTILILMALAMAACGPDPSGEPVQVVVAPGSSFQRVTDSLAASSVIGGRESAFFRIYARLRGVDRAVKPGRYEFLPGERWGRILSDLTSGRALTARLTIPEGFTLARMAPRLAAVAEAPADSILALLHASEGLADSLGVPGPGLEGYLFPDTYIFEPGAPIADMIGTMVRRYQSFWTPERRARMEETGMSEREIVTLASIIEAEALWNDEMPTISSVYTNRLRIGLALYADPTVLYALGGTRERLLYAAIDSVADNPYNTYRHAGLPPGPIGSPGELALEAALYPADTPYFYFVARPDGTHVFTRSLDEHNAAKAQAQREWDTVRSPVRVPGPGPADEPPPPGDPPPLERESPR